MYSAVEEFEFGLGLTGNSIYAANPHSFTLSNGKLPQ